MGHGNGYLMSRIGAAEKTKITKKESSPLNAPSARLCSKSTIAHGSMRIGKQEYLQTSIPYLIFKASNPHRWKRGDEDKYMMQPFEDRHPQCRALSITNVSSTAESFPPRRREVRKTIRLRSGQYLMYLRWRVDGK